VVKWNLEGVLGGMSVNDSFFVPCLDCDPLRYEIRRLSEQFGITVKTRTVTENYIKGLRTWRVR
jgi:hypothetical protein